jgi:hypothetical protein
MFVNIVTLSVNQKDRHLFSCCLSEPSEPFREVLDGDSACEITSPVPVLDIRVGKEIIRFHWVSLPLGVKFSHVNAWCRVEKLHFEVGFFRVDVINELINILISHFSIRPFEVRTHGVHEDVASVMQGLVPEIINKLAGSVVQVIPFEILIINNGLGVPS